jgi:FixJ family two-component response regulator
MTPAIPIVFVVDHNISVREPLQLPIQSEGWHPETFASPQDFLDRPRSLVPSCLVLDVSLSGPQWSRPMQKRVVVERPDMPIIFLT